MTAEEYSKTIALQKQIAYRYKGRAVYKYRLNIPSDMIEKLGWQKHGIILRIKVVKNNKLEISEKDMQR
jgi:hypothetical protein